MAPQSNQPEEVFVRKGQVTKFATQVTAQAVSAPVSVQVGNSPGGLVRRGAIKRKTIKETTSSHASADRFKTDFRTSRRFSFDEHRHPSVRFAAPPANIGRHRNAGHEKYVTSSRAEPLPASGLHQSRSHMMSDYPPTMFEDILGKEMSHPEVPSKKKTKTRLIPEIPLDLLLRGRH